MKRLILILVCCLLLTAAGCAPREYAQVAATTLPVYEFTLRLCQGTDITVTRLVNESVSCLHDYSLNVSQVRELEAARHVVISGAGMEAFMDDLLQNRSFIDASAGISLVRAAEGHDHEGESHDGHRHEEDPHIWLSPAHAAVMAENICAGLTRYYPHYADVFAANLQTLTAEIEELNVYGQEALSGLSCRQLITFHDGFTYFAQAFDLEIIRAVEEESGSEASAAELIELIEEVEHHALPAIFTETNGSTSAASIISRETGTAVYSLDMAMSGDSWFEAMYHNIDTIKEALK